MVYAFNQEVVCLISNHASLDRNDQCRFGLWRVQGYSLPKSLICTAPYAIFVFLVARPLHFWVLLYETLSSPEQCR